MTSISKRDTRNVNASSSWESDFVAGPTYAQHSTAQHKQKHTICLARVVSASGKFSIVQSLCCVMLCCAMRERLRLSRCKRLHELFDGEHAYIHYKTNRIKCIMCCFCAPAAWQVLAWA